MSTLPGIVTDQPEIFECEPALSDDTGVNDLDLLAEPTDDAIALIEVPVQQAFAYFAERENEIAKFYVQRHGEYKIAGDKPEDETDIEKYHRLVSEVNELLNKFQTNQADQSERRALSLNNAALASNLEVLSKQLKALEFAAEDGSLSSTQTGYTSIKSKLDKLKDKVSDSDGEPLGERYFVAADETAKLIRVGALERRLNMLETLLGNNDEKMQTLFKVTKCDNLIEATETLSSWLSLFKSDNIQRVSRELEYLTQRLEKITEQSTSESGEGKQLDQQARSKLDQLYNLVIATDKHRGMVPTIIHRLNAMEELQRKSAQVATTVNHLEQVQAQIVDNLQSNKGELSSLTEMFAKNIDLIKEFSRDIDSRIAAIRERQ